MSSPARFHPGLPATLVAVVSAAGTVLASAAATPGVRPQEQRPAYRASVEIVRLHAAVLDGDGNPVTGLTARDFDDDLDGALEAAHQAVSSDPALWDGSFLQAAVLWMQDDPGAALAPLRQALWLEPGVAATQHLGWQLSVELGDLETAWDHAIRAQLAGADMKAEMELLAARSVPPADVEARLNVPRVFVEGPRSDDPERYARLAAVVRALSRSVSDSPLLGLVRYPLGADYFLYIDAEDPDRRRPGALESRLELYNYADRRLWRRDMDIDDLASEQAIAAAVRRALVELEEWLGKER